MGGRAGRGVTVLAALLLVAALGGCGSRASAGSQQRVGSEETATEPVTPRSLAAGVLRHVDADVVTRVGGHADELGVGASVETELDSLRTVIVTVRPVRDGRFFRRCGTGATYVTVECDRDAGRLVEVSRLKPGGPPLPDLQGLYRDGRRGVVMVQVFGEPDGTATDLVRALLADPLLGVETSAELVAAGDAYEGFETDEITAGITVG